MSVKEAYAIGVSNRFGIVKLLPTSSLKHHRTVRSTEELKCIKQLVDVKSSFEVAKAFF